MTPDPLAPILADHLHGLGRLRVWSLIVTILGDSIEPRGGRVRAARLAAILDRLGVGRGAQRTALSRLVADGWIDRARDPKDGRAAIYGFSDSARAEFTRAARLVYAAPGTVTAGDWMVTRSDDPRGIALAPGVGLWPAAFAPTPSGLTLIGKIETVSDPGIGPGPDQRAETEAIAALAGQVGAVRSSPDGLDAVAARTVLVHRWRRYVLRYPEWPEALAPRDWPGLALRAEVAGAYARIAAQSDAWLSRPVPGCPGLPAATAGDRFG
ncbi:PaaX family transcriptional regulator C-terminal domain-containing protein [Roseicyclus persicicus]|uniref:Winged helix DNA-binding protein n=1 Tax=Roseicyclus persicicus TaxID=2650661 RepID=A0A7X6H1L8_9RHOB|nr:PaaX family transcriptional regulator C-terminal domain-containing protein [Roseibacterium persicicum]NKX45172.1 winged helix DNA-binding protein [Roseibacterium persicicum]